MNEQDPLEEELAAFRPLEPTRELKDRVFQRLAYSVLRQRARPWNRLVTSFSNANAIAIAGGLAAVLVGVVLWRGDHSVTTPTALDLAVQPSLSAAFDDSLPSLWTYRAALADSRDGLDALLDKHANRTSQITAEQSRDNVFVRFDRGTNTLTGEL